jgi:energy-coupling factor transporter ATP-binding protein EcfA2
MKNADPFCIRRIRLINFHNFVDETITIPANGHLFLLGDNGCGKTTVLDAIHYVLSAGQAMEFNSAARVTGRRDGGRRLQGVILRYNIETGVMNSQGGITYAALEITGRNGRPLTIGLGLSTGAMDEKVQSWGVIREAPLEEIPFIIEEEEGRRPANRREFKEGLGSSRGFYRDKTTYRHELAARLFGGKESYQEICRFLRMGKAYREIAAGAADYHELFKHLLPEPHTSIFEQIIDGLRTLDNARTLLDDLERKVAYVRTVQQTVQEIENRRETTARYDWLLSHWQSQQNNKEQEKNLHDQERLQGQLHEAELSLQTLKRQEQQIHERLDDLKTKDSSGLVRQEKNCKAELAEKKARLTLARETTKEAERINGQAEKETERQKKSLTQGLGALVSECGHRSRALPFSISSLQQGADELFRNPVPERILKFEADDILALSADQLTNLSSQAALLNRELQIITKEIETQEEELTALRQQETPRPRADIADFLQHLQNDLITATPLYLGLEWLPGLYPKTQGRIEELIGGDVLATVIVREADYPKCRQQLHNWPGIRISCKSRGLDELPDWMREVFDITSSNPEALCCLATEMESSSGPASSRLHGREILSFRSHERVLHGHKSRLIGAESRRLALLEEIKDIEAEIAKGRKKARTLQRDLKDNQQAQEIVQGFKASLAKMLRANREEARLLIKAEEHALACRERLQEAGKQQDALSTEVDHLALRHQELTALIAKEGLAGLDRRIHALERQWRQNRVDTDQKNQEIGAIKDSGARLTKRAEQLRREAMDIRRELEEKEALIKARLPEISDVAYYVLKTKTGQQFSSYEAVFKKRAEAEKEALELILTLKKVQLNDPEFGAALRFSYHEEENEVRDFRARPLPEVLKEQELAVKEQQAIINDRTIGLFKKIIMTDLMNYLRNHVSSLEQMIRSINNLLSRRSFGGQRYRFRVRPLPEYRRLVEIVKKHSLVDPEAEEEIIQFFKDHQEEITAAEIGAVPDELDYRNWYRYDLEVSSIGEHGVIMDKSTKSIGSGGEQAVPNYLLILTIAHFLYRGKKVRLHSLLFDEAFYGIDSGRRDQLLGFATDLDLQLFVASPDQDGVRQEIKHSTTLVVTKDKEFNIHLRDFHWQNPEVARQPGLFEEAAPEVKIEFGEELGEEEDTLADS